MLPALIFILYV